MADNNFSTHAPTGYSKVVVSPSEYSAAGRTIGYPAVFDAYVKKISNEDGSSNIIETRLVTDLVGSKLYLYHRPLINADGTISTISTSNGTIDTTATNARQGYIVFSVVPTTTFTISYTAAPDCINAWHLNTLQDSVMEIEKILGPTQLTGYPGLRNLKFGIFDRPDDTVASGVAQNAYFLSHLDRNIRISSSDDSTLATTRGSQHTIQIGRATDSFASEVTGFRVYQSDTTKPLNIYLTEKTGDFVQLKGKFSGAGPVTIGGSEWPNYSGVVFTTGLTGTFYSGAMLRVHGDIAVMGGIKSIGPITVVSVTGTASEILGDFVVRDELFVFGPSYFTGPVQVNQSTNHDTLFIDTNIVSNNIGGAGGNGQSLVDNLDCSEVAWTYTTIAAKQFPNSVIAGPVSKASTPPKKSLSAPWFTLGADKLVGDQFILTGRLNATAGPSGAHPAIFQLLLDTEIVSGFYAGTVGTLSGVWSKGMMDPGSMYIKMTNGTNVGFTAPIYNHTVEQVSTNKITRLNVFCPSMPASPPATNETFMLYNPGSVPYNFIGTVGGASPTFTVSGTTSEPLKIAFDDHVRILTSSTASFSLTQALDYSVSGNSATTVTGVAYIIADSTNTDPELSPVFRARPVPIRMQNETVIGEVIASKTAGSWSIIETVSYRPNGHYDSAWIPVFSNTAVTLPSGRAVPGFNSSSTSPLRIYFTHDIGPDINLVNFNGAVYFGTPYTGNMPSNINQTMSYMHSMFGQDVRVGHGLSGTFIRLPLGADRTTSAISNRDASVFYMDSRVIGIDISPSSMLGFPTGATSTTAPSYIRLVLNRDV